MDEIIDVDGDDLYDDDVDDLTGGGGDSGGVDDSQRKAYTCLKYGMT